MLEIYKTTTEYNIYTDGNKNLRSDVIYYVEDSGAVHFFTNNVDGEAKVYNAYTQGGGGGIIPYGNILLNENGTGFDVSSYATASVNVPIPPGYILPKGVYAVTDNSPEIDVSQYAYVSVDVPVPPGYIIPTGNISLTENTQEIDVSQYATATVNVAGGGFNPSGDIEITQNGNNIDVYTYATASVAVPLDPSISSITIADGTREIGENAFTGSEGLEEVVLPDTIEEIGANAFDGCSNLDTVTVNAETPPALGEDSFSKDNTPDIFVPYNSLEDYIEEWSDYAEHIFPISSDYNIAISSESISIDANNDYEGLIGEIMGNLIGYDSSWMPTAMISIYENATGNGVVEDMPYNNPSLSDQAALNNAVTLMQQNQYDVYVTIDNTTHNGTSYNEGTYHFYAGSGEVKYSVSFKGDIEIENDDPSTVDVNNLISAIQDNIDGYDPSWMDEASVTIEDSDHAQLASISDIYNPVENEIDALQGAIYNVSLNDVWTINLYLPQGDHNGMTYESLSESCNAKFKNVTVTRGEVWMKATVHTDNAGKARVLGWSDNLLYDGSRYWSYIKINGGEPISTYTDEMYHSMYKNTLPYLADGLEANSYVEVEYKSSYWSDDDNASGSVIITVGGNKGLGGLRGTSISYFNEIPSYFKSISTYGLAGTGKLSYFIVPDNISYINEYALADSGMQFFDTKGRGDAIIYGDSALKGSHISYLELSDTYINNAPYCFSNTKMAYLYAPELEEINSSYVFYNNTYLSHIDLPSLTYIDGNYTFGRCWHLAYINAPQLETINHNGVFFANSDLSYIDLPSLAYINGKYTFGECTNATYIDMPNVSYIGAYTFYDCTNAGRADLPNAAYIEAGAFNFCRSLETLELPNIRKIGTYAFANTYALTTIILGENIESIGTNIFWSTKANTMAKKTVYCYALTPPSGNPSNWYRSRITNPDPQADIYVPSQSYSLYVQAWPDYSYIYPME